MTKELQLKALKGLLKENGMKVTNVDVKNIYEAFEKMITDGIVEHGEVKFGKLVKFVVEERAERQIRDIKSQEMITIPAADVVKVKKMSGLKDLV